MKISSQLLLTFLLNACWQVAVVAAFASLASWLLRNSAARYRHWVWVAALVLSFGIPITSSTSVLGQVFAPTSSVAPTFERQRFIQPFGTYAAETAQADSFVRGEAFLLNRTLALVLVAVYLAIVVFSSLRLLQAWLATRRILLTAIEVTDDTRVHRVLQMCASSIMKTVAAVKVCSSTTVPVPVTIGVSSPVIILPQELLSETSDEVLTSAIGHELIHVRRRDYALNLVYELLYLSLSFHPAAALIRRRIRQTRELSCDELVAERILNPEAYARSLVKLASATPTLRRLSVTTTVGIADADILEARIMSLLRKPKLDTRRKRMLLIVASMLLLVPCLAVASFAMRFDLAPLEAGVKQEPAQQEKQRREEEITKTRSQADEIKLRQKMEMYPQLREELMRKMQVEEEMRSIKQAALVRLARINMDQAIQIATSQVPGKVLNCSLDADKWEKPGELAKDGVVFYRVTIVSSDDPEVTKHVWVNAVDGSLIRTETELPRKQRSPNPQ